MDPIRFGPLGFLAAPSLRPRRRPAPAEALETRFGAKIQPNLLEKQATQFIRKHAAAIHKLVTAAYAARWDISCLGAEVVMPGQSKTNLERVMETQQVYKDYFNNPQAFADVKALLQHRDKLSNRLMVRQLEKLARNFEDAGKSEALLEQEWQVMARTNELAAAYDRYMPEVNGQTISGDDLDQRLETETDPTVLKQLWLARQGHGQQAVENQTLAQAFVDLVWQRNAVAVQNTNLAGKPYANYFQMMLDKTDINADQLMGWVDELEKATRKPFETYLATQQVLSQKRYGITAEEALLPWFGSGNLKQLLQFDLDPYLQGKDPKALVEKTANLMGESLQSIFSRSQYVKDGQTRDAIYFDPEQDQGKTQTWFCFPQDAPFDVRILGAADPNHQVAMAETVKSLLHEGMGHGLDGIRLGAKLPLLLRSHHDVTAEGNALLFEELVYDPQWLESGLALPKTQAQQLARLGRLYRDVEKLTQLRWYMALIAFEKQCYENPGQDLGELWWATQEKYMGVKKPSDAPEVPYASVMHLISHPVYCPNYFLAELVRAQKLAYLNDACGGLLTPEAGKLIRAYRAKGESYDWADLVERMTQKPLGCEALKNELVGITLPVGAAI